MGRAMTEENAEISLGDWIKFRGTRVTTNHSRKMEVFSRAENDHFLCVEDGGGARIQSCLTSEEALAVGMALVKESGLTGAFVEGELPETDVFDNLVATKDARVSCRLNVDPETVLETARRWLAVHAALVKEQKKNGRLEARRDELAGEYVAAGATYAGVAPGAKRLIDRVMELEGDVGGSA